MKKQIIYLCLLFLQIMFSTTYSQIIPDFKVNDDQGNSHQFCPNISADGNANFAPVK